MIKKYHSYDNVAFKSDLKENGDVLDGDYDGSDEVADADGDNGRNHDAFDDSGDHKATTATLIFTNSLLEYFSVDGVGLGWYHFR